MSALTVVLVGCGRMGQHHARVIAADPDVRDLCFVDTVGARAAVLAQRHGGRVGAPEHADLVVIAATTEAHSRLAQDWLSRGARVLIEKPIALQVDDAQALVGEGCFVGHSERFNPGVRAGQLRGLRRVTVERVVPRDVGADVVTDLLVHDIDLPGRQVRGLACVHAQGDPFTEVVTHWMGEGFEGKVHVSRLGAPRRSWEGLDDGGPFHIDLLAGVARRDGQLCDADSALDALGAQWQAFRQGEGIATASDGVQALLLAHGVLKQLRRQA